MTWVEACSPDGGAADIAERNRGCRADVSKNERKKNQIMAESVPATRNRGTRPIASPSRDWYQSVAGGRVAHGTLPLQTNDVTTKSPDPAKCDPLCSARGRPNQPRFRRTLPHRSTPARSYVPGFKRDGCGERRRGCGLWRLYCARCGHADTAPKKKKERKKSTTS